MGIGLLIGLAIIADWTIRLVVLNAKLSGQDSYTNVSRSHTSTLLVTHAVQVMHAVFGRAGSASVSFFQFAFAFGG